MVATIPGLLQRDNIRHKSGVSRKTGSGSQARTLKLTDSRLTILMIKLPKLVYNYDISP